MTVQGTLATLQCALDPAQYRLVRGVLAHNLAECVADLPPHAPHGAHAPHATHATHAADTAHHEQVTQIVIFLYLRCYYCTNYCGLSVNLVKPIKPAANAILIDIF